MLRQDDRLENLENDYSKERREMEIKVMSAKNRWTKKFFQE
jgi:hypothetical protein